MTDPARAPLRERLLEKAKELRDYVELSDVVPLLREAASRLGEPEAPTPWQLLKRVREGLERCRVYTVSFEANGETRRDLGMLRGDAAKAIAALEAEYPRPAESPVSAREPEARPPTSCVCGHSRGDHGNDGTGHCGATAYCRAGGCKYFRPASAESPVSGGTETALLEAAKSAVALLDSIDWTDHSSETDAANVQHALETTINRIEADAFPLVRTEPAPQSQVWMAVETLRGLIRSETGHIAYVDDHIDELIAAVRAESASKQDQDQEPLTRGGTPKDGL